MKIFVDENIPNITVQTLKEKNHLITDIRKTSLEGSNDSKVWDITQKNKCLLITTDKGFSKHRFENHFGILIVCFRRSNQFKISRIYILSMP